MLSFSRVSRWIVHQRREAFLVAVPDVPDEGALLEAGDVLLEELVAQPLRQRQAVATGVAQQLSFACRRPVAAEGFGEQRTQAIHGCRFAAHGRQADDAVVVDQAVEFLAACDPVTRLVREFHLGIRFRRPAVAEQTGDGNLQRISGGFRVAVENPLRRVVGIGFGQAVGVAFGGDVLPVGEVEGTLTSVSLVTLSALSIFN